MMAQVIAGDITVAQIAPALEEQDALPSFGEDAGGDTTAQASADDDDVVSGSGDAHEAEGRAGRSGS